MGEIKYIGWLRGLNETIHIECLEKCLDTQKAINIVTNTSTTRNSNTRDWRLGVVGRAFQETTCLHMLPSPIYIQQPCKLQEFFSLNGKNKIKVQTRGQKTRGSSPDCQKLAVILEKL